MGAATPPRSVFFQTWTLQAPNPPEWAPHPTGLSWRQREAAGAGSPRSLLWQRWLVFRSAGGRRIWLLKGKTDPYTLLWPLKPQKFGWGEKGDSYNNRKLQEHTHIQNWMLGRCLQGFSTVKTPPKHNCPLRVFILPWLWVCNSAADILQEPSASPTWNDQGVAKPPSPLLHCWGCVEKLVLLPQ